MAVSFELDSVTGRDPSFVVFGSDTPNEKAKVRLPSPSGGGPQWNHIQIGHKKWANIKLPKKELRTSLFYYKISEYDFFIEDRPQFETDWTILKLYSSEWNVEQSVA